MSHVDQRADGHLAGFQVRIDRGHARGLHQADHESGREHRLPAAEFGKAGEQVRHGLVHRHRVPDDVPCSDH